MRWFLDAGALVAVERGDRTVTDTLRGRHAERRDLVTHGGIIGQVWRQGARRARLARLLPGVLVTPLDGGLGRAAGELLAHSGTSDVIDAALVVLASHGDKVLTSDPEDIARLAEVARVHIDIVPV